MSTLTAHDRDELPDGEFAFAKQRKGPIEDAVHVRSAIARFNPVKGVTDSERDQAWRRILAAAEKFGLKVHERDRRGIGQGGGR